MATHSEPSAAPELTVDGKVATVRLRRSAKANRLESDDVDVLRGHFDWLHQRHAEIRAVIVTGTGKHFSAGFDLGSIQAAVNGDATARFGAMVDALEALPQTTVCAANGGIFGGATDLALACDFRLGVPQTRLFMPAARFGLHYYASGLRRYVTRLGLNAAKRLLLLADELDAQALLDIGYLTQIAEADNLQGHARALADRASTMGPLASAGMKAALNAIAAASYDPVVGEKVYRQCMASADLAEGLTAAREGRSPRFEAR